MGVKLYSGTGSSQSVSGVGFSPDWVWIKRRDLDRSHMIFDIVRGLPGRLASNETSAENTDANNLTSFNSDGFTTSTGDAVNGSGGSYVAWCFDAGSSTVTNTSGSISSQVRANASAGFSVATWTGSGSGSATVGHGLGVAPRFMIIKDRSLARNWLVYHTSLGATSGVALNSTNVPSGADAGWWNNTAPTSTVATIGTYGNEASNYVGYFWTPVSGYSSMGSYVGNGSADGPFVFTGHRSRWLMIKDTTISSNWRIYDTARDTYNVAGAKLYPNSSVAENSVSGETASTNTIDFLSNGFKLRTSNSETNFSGDTYIWASFAENPFQYARAR
jgi:hypothetical protein